MKVSKFVRLGGLAVALPFVVVVGCGDDDDNNGGPANPTATMAADTPTPGGATPEPTATTEPGAPTATPGGGGNVPVEVEAFVGSVIGSLGGLSDIAAPGSGGAGLGFPVTVPCDGGGNLTVDCNSGGPGIIFEVDAANCDNPDVFINGLITVESSGSCLGNPLPIGSPADISFDGDIAVEDFEGSADFTSTVNVATNGDVEFDASGSVDANCLGGTATFQTTTTLFTPGGSVCPTAGVIEITLGGASHEVVYGSNGLTINGESFASCEDVATCS